MIAYTLDTKVMTDTANRNNEIVIIKTTTGNDFHTVFIEGWRNRYLFILAIQTFHSAKTKPKPTAHGLAQVFNFIFMRIEGSSCNFM